MTDTQTDKVHWYRTHIHEMTVATLNRHRVEIENRLRMVSVGGLAVSPADQTTLTNCLELINTKLDELLPNVGANVSDRDVLNKGQIKERWPDELASHTLLVHYHFHELIFAWNINPYRRNPGSASVDEYAEQFGLTRLAFCGKADADAFIDHYMLDDFIVKIDDIAGSEFYFVTFSNKFATSDVNEFLEVYNSAMNAIAALHQERNRAIRNDGGRVGFACIDHYAQREGQELNRIFYARQKLGAGYKALNENPNGGVNAARG